MNKYINIKTIGKIFAATILCFTAKTIAYAAEVKISRPVEVSATVGALSDTDTENLSELNILRVGVVEVVDDSSTVNVGFGNISVVVDNNVIVSRYESPVVELEYLAARGPWDLFIYTDDGVAAEVDSQGLVGTSGDNAGLTLPLKFSRLPLNSDVPAAANDDANWSGNTAVYSFVTDVDADPKSTLTSSIEADAASSNDSFKFVFGTDVIGAAPGSYSAEVIIELSMQ